jgi:uncharacterized membrane protein
MPAADQAIAEGIMQKHIGEIMEKWRAFHPAYQRAIQALRTENFDPTEAKAAVDAADQRMADLKAVLQSTLLEIAQNVSPEGRKHIHAPGL